MSFLFGLKTVSAALQRNLRPWWGLPQQANQDHFPDAGQMVPQIIARHGSHGNQAYPTVASRRQSSCWKLPSGEVAVMRWCLILLVVLTACRPAPVPDGHRRVEPVPAPAPVDSTHVRLLMLHNEARTKVGASPLSLDGNLNQFADSHAQWMARTGWMVHSRMGFSGFRRKAENIAMGYTTEDQVTAKWLNSRGHRRNILDSRLRAVGFGRAVGKNGRVYWCTVFGG